MKKATLLLVSIFLFLAVLSACRDVRSDDRLFLLTSHPVDPPVWTSQTTRLELNDAGSCELCGVEVQTDCGHEPPEDVAAFIPCEETTEVFLPRPKHSARTKVTEPAPTTTTPTTTRKQTQATTSKAKTTTTAATTAGTTTSTTTKATTKEEAGFFNDAYERQVVELINVERAKEGLAPLTMNSSLRDSARTRAREIINCWGHKRPDGKRFSSAIKIGFCGAGENIAAGQSTPERVVKSWMASQGHRDNIMNPKFKLIGVGCYYDYSTPYKSYWSQLFVTP